MFLKYFFCVSDEDFLNSTDNRNISKVYQHPGKKWSQNGSTLEPFWETVLCTRKWLQGWIRFGHLYQTLCKPKNPRCLGCATQNLPPQHRGMCMKGFVYVTHNCRLSVCSLHRSNNFSIWAYSCTGGGMPQGHTQLLHPSDF